MIKKVQIKQKKYNYNKKYQQKKEKKANIKNKNLIFYIDNKNQLANKKSIMQILQNKKN